MHKILIIEDEKELSNILSDLLIKEGFLVYQGFDGESGIDYFYDTNPDLVLLDINLPKVNGWEICKIIRRESKTPIIFMTARDSEIDEIKGLELGGDDYITKPFNTKILLLKIKKILRLDSIFQYKFKALNLNFTQHIFTIGEEELDFSKKELELLNYLIINREKTLSRELLFNEIWGYDSDAELRVVDTLVTRVRKKLGVYADLIKTLRGVGYIFNEY